MSRNFQIVSPSGNIADIHLDGTKVHRRILSPHRQAVLKQNAELRKNRGALRSLSFGGLALDVPTSDIPMIERFFPGAMNAAHPDHKWMLRAFMRSPASIPYRVHDKPRGVSNAAYIKT